MDLTWCNLVGALVATPGDIDLIAVFLGGLTGAIFAVQRRFAVTGVLSIAIATGLGGSMLRDLLLNTMPVALTNPRYLPTAVAAAVVGFFFASAVHRGRLMLDILDPIWMGLFAVIGVQQALNVGLSVWAAVLVGCVTALGGAVARDVLAGETPELMLPGPINYTAALLGSVLYAVLVSGFSAPVVAAEIITIAVVFVLRMIALRFGISAPVSMDVARYLVHRRRRRRRRRRRLELKRLAKRPGGSAPPAASAEDHDTRA